MINHLAALVRTIPDYPGPGILFRDITPLLRDAAALEATVEAMTDLGARREGPRRFALVPAGNDQAGAEAHACRPRIDHHLIWPRLWRLEFLDAHVLVGTEFSADDGAHGRCPGGQKQK